jgi:predicted nuclease with RNAse H fold
MRKMRNNNKKNMENKWIAGFDPGGKNKFGWCVARTIENSKLEITACGVSSNARESFENVIMELKGETLFAAGIDSPLFWSADGMPREVDVYARKVIDFLGAPAVGGTVQNVNSLRGACLVQGLTICKLLVEKYSNIKITEAHPKALLWSLLIANKRNLVVDINVEMLSPEYINMNKLNNNLLNDKDDKRDAILATIAARAMAFENSDWEDISAIDKKPIFLSNQVYYWMPKVIITPPVSCKILMK